MARRRRREEEPENLERWLVSYADFITLLFAFFVVMYAISSVNEGKYRVLSETLNEVFSVSARSDKPIQVGEPPRDVLALPDAPLAAQQHRPPPVESAGEGGGGGTEAGDGAALRIADELSISLQNHLDQGLMRIRRDGDRVEIEMAERMLFGSGEARLSTDALVPLRALARTLARITQPPAGRGPHRQRADLDRRLPVELGIVGGTRGQRSALPGPLRRRAVAHVGGGHGRAPADRREQ
jgi:chemotaxis protein MotB